MNGSADGPCVKGVGDVPRNPVQGGGVSPVGTGGIDYIDEVVGGSVMDPRTNPTHGYYPSERVDRRGLFQSRSSRLSSDGSGVNTGVTGLHGPYTIHETINYLLTPVKGTSKETLRTDGGRKIVQGTDVGHTRPLLPPYKLLCVRKRTLSRLVLGFNLGLLRKPQFRSRSLSVSICHGRPPCHLVPVLPSVVFLSHQPT